MLTRARRSARDDFGAVAQLVERLLCKEKVRSSNLLGSTDPHVGVSLEVRRREVRAHGEEARPRTTSFHSARSRPRTTTFRGRTRTSRWRTLTSEEEDENEFRQ